MKKLLYGVLTLVIVVAGARWFYTWQTLPYRYRLTVEIAVDGETYTGSSVIDAWLVPFQWGIGGGTGVNPQFRGEAVAIDVGNGRHVFAVLGFGRNGNGNKISFATLPARALGLIHTPDWWRKMAAHRGIIELRRPFIPTLVTFLDARDPNSAQLLYAVGRPMTPGQGSSDHRAAPIVEADNFTEVFGRGSNFGRATIQIVSRGWWPLNNIGLTGEPVTTGIATLLPILEKLKQEERTRKFDGGYAGPYRPTFSHFKRG